MKDEYLHNTVLMSPRNWSNSIVNQDVSPQANFLIKDTRINRIQVKVLNMLCQYKKLTANQHLTANILQMRKLDQYHI